MLGVSAALVRARVGWGQPFTLAGNHAIREPQQLGRLCVLSRMTQVVIRLIQLQYEALMPLQKERNAGRRIKVLAPSSVGV